MNDIQKVYDAMFFGAETIAKRGAEHAQLLFLFSPSATGYKAARIMALEGGKEDIARTLSAAVKGAPQMWLVVHVSEAWSRRLKEGEAPDLDTPVAQQPEAFEIVVFAFFREGEVWLAECVVDHKANTLEKAPLKKIKVGDVEGRFIPQHTR